MNRSVIPTIATAPAPPARASRAFRLLALASVVVLGVVGYALYYFLYAQYFQSTDDSYVDGDVVQITSEMSGHRHRTACRRYAIGRARTRRSWNWIPPMPRLPSGMRRRISAAPYEECAR